MVDISTLFDQIPFISPEQFIKLEKITETYPKFIVPIIYNDFLKFYTNEQKDKLVLGYFNNNLYLTYTKNQRYINNREFTSLYNHYYNIGFLKYYGYELFDKDNFYFGKNDKYPDNLYINWKPTVKLNGKDITISLYFIAHEIEVINFKKYILNI